MPRHTVTTAKPMSAWASAVLCMAFVGCSPSAGLSNSPSSTSSEVEAPPAGTPNPTLQSNRRASAPIEQPASSTSELPAQQLAPIIIGLIDGVRTKADLTEPRIEGLTGLSLQRLDSRDASYAKGTTIEGGRFAIGLERYAADDVRLEIATVPDKQREAAGATTCTLAFDKLRGQLDAAGYRSDRSTGVHGKASNWRFRKNGQVVHIDLYPTAPLDRGGIECIEHITIVME